MPDKVLCNVAYRSPVTAYWNVNCMGIREQNPIQKSERRSGEGRATLVVLRCARDGVTATSDYRSYHTCSILNSMNASRSTTSQTCHAKGHMMSILRDG